MTTELSKVVEKAKADHRVRFTSLAHLLTMEFLKETWGLVNKRGVHGVEPIGARASIAATMQTSTVRSPPRTPTMRPGRP